MESSSAAQIIGGVISYDSYGRRKDVTLLTLMWHGFCIDVTACDFQVLLKEDTPMQPVNTKDPLTVFPHNQFGLVWHLWPKSQNARLWLLSLKVALLRVSWTQTHLIKITLFQSPTCLTILTESSGQILSIWEGKPVENMLAYRKFLQVLELFNNVLKTPERSLQLDCKWIVYKLTT